MSDPKVEISKLSHFRPQVANANAHTQRGLGELSKAYNEVGYVAPMTAAANGEMLDGSARLETAATQFSDEALVIRHDGRRPIVMVREDVADADSPLAKKISYGANRIFELDLSWDPEQMARDIEAGIDFGGLFTEEEQASILSSLKPEPPEDTGPQVDKAEELRQKWGVELGQLWTLGDHRLICGDCTDRAVVERVMGGDRARYGMHDPPYGINVVVASDNGGGKPFGKQTGTIGFRNTVKTNEYKPVIGDNEPFDPSSVLCYSQDSVLWGANYYADKLEPKKGWLVWDKKGREDWRDNFSDCELAWTSLPIVTKIFRHTWMGMVQEGQREERIHPTQKPVQLFVKIMDELFIENGIVVDFYLGSGTTLIACQNLNRQCRAIEIDPGYVAVTLERFATTFGIEPKLVEL